MGYIFGIRKIKDVQDFFSDIQSDRIIYVEKSCACADYLVEQIRKLGEDENVEFEDDDIDTNEKEKKLREYLRKIVKLFCDSEIRVHGSADAIHNLSVTYDRIDLLQDACNILERVMQRFKSNTYLLADYIKYGKDCGCYFECEEYIKQLQSVSKELWTWRAYSFQIDYLLDKFDRIDGENFDENKQVILSLVDEYIHWSCGEPRYLDQAYYDKASVLRKLGKYEEEKEILSKAIQLSMSSKCSLRLADIEFENGNYSRAIELLYKGTLVEEVEVSMNKGYAYLVSALSKATLFLEEQRDTAKEGGRIAEYSDRVKEIYKDANIAKGLLKEHRLANRVDSLVFVLEIQTGIKNGDDMDY